MHSKTFCTRNGELPANDLPGISKEIHQLRANPKLRSFGKWGNRSGHGRSPLMEAVLKMRAQMG